MIYWESDLEWERKKQQQPKEKQHIKKQHNTHTTTIKNERKTKEEKPRLKTKNRKEKK